MTDSRPTVLVTGAAGALGRHLCPALARAGWHVVPTARSVDEQVRRTTGLDDLWCVDAASSLEVMDALGTKRPSLVVGCAAFTDVGKAEQVPSLAWAGNVDTALATAEACDRMRVPFLLVSSDYAATAERDDWGPWPTIRERGYQQRGYGPADPVGLWNRGVLVYAAAKRAAEQVALERGAWVARVAHLPPEKAERYTWVNGYSLANREWTEPCAERLARLCCTFRGVSEPRWPGSHVLGVGPALPCTVEGMVRSRWPGHPALAQVVRNPGQHVQRVGFAAPTDTTFSDPWSDW